MQRLFKKDLRDSLKFKSLVWYEIEIHLNKFLKLFKINCQNVIHLRRKLRNI